MRRHVLLLAALTFAFGCSRDREVRERPAPAPPPTARTMLAPSPGSAPGLAADAVLAPDGSAPAAAPRVLVDPRTGEALPPGLVAVLEAGPGGPVHPGEMDLVMEEPLHRGRIPIVFSSSSAIDLPPLRTPDTALREDRGAPVVRGVPRREAFDPSAAPAAPAPDLR